MVTTVVVEKRPSADEVAQRQAQSRGAPRAKAKPAAWNSAATANEPAVGAITDSDRYHRISLGAYFRAQQRGFAPGHMWEDWLSSEQEVAAELATKSASERDATKV